MYIESSEGFLDHRKETKVCKLDKSMYGLKQAHKMT